ncbi:probable assembly chaperone of rpl4 [Octopus sinensis]|uniref:Probable assembly chaperone of rpl4 n=1 Tax=Octopus sinensis TaxID=2607531 RepID=A0A6P7SR73_9MOLL|nr:probable assembly chaperone of rpl4 [Octopus sinensis]
MGKKKARSNSRESAPVGNTLPFGQAGNVAVGSKEKSKCDVEQLLSQAEKCIDQFQFELAHKFCLRAIEREPDNLKALETAGHVLMELKQHDAGKQFFLKAVEFQPDLGHAKYMYLGQTEQGESSVRYFLKGIEVMLKEKELNDELSKAAEGSTTPAEVEHYASERDISSAYCAIAEIYMTDLCLEEGAADKCQENVEKAVAADPQNPEAYQLKAQFLMNIEKIEEAKEMIEKSVSLWLPQLQENDDDIPENMPGVSYDTRIVTSKILIELELYETANEVLFTLLDETDEDPHVWYLMGYAALLESSKRKGDEAEDCLTNAREYLQSALKTYHKVEFDDPEMLKHIQEMIEKVGPGEDEEAAPEAAGNVSEVDFETDGENEQTSDKTENTEAAKPMEQDD